MNPVTLSTLATGFAVTGAAIGIPSFAVLLLYAANAIRNRLNAGKPSGSNFGENPDALLLLLKGMTAAIGALDRAAGSLGQFVLSGLAIIASVGLVFAIACWFTGRGLHAHANWARVSAVILLVLAMLPSLVLTLSFHHLGRVFMLAIVILCVFGLRTLWIGYAPPTL